MESNLMGKIMSYLESFRRVGLFFMFTKQFVKLVQEDIDLCWQLLHCVFLRIQNILDWTKERLTLVFLFLECLVHTIGGHVSEDTAACCLSDLVASIV